MITVAWTTHTGLVRRRNEDHVGVLAAGESAGPGSDGEVRTITVSDVPALVAIADGLGGHPYGDVASRIAVESVLVAAPSDPGALVVAVHAANAEIYAAMSDRAQRTMGTTLTAVLVHDDGIAVVNVGDSPVFELVDGELAELSVMDSLSPDEDPSGHVVTQTLGGRSRYSDIDPHITEISVGGAQRLLVCTDGLTNYVDHTALTAALSAPDPETAVAALVDLALIGGGGDNITIAVLDIT